MRIDVHAHYFPTSYLERMVALGRTDLHLSMGQSTDLSARLEAMDATSCDAQILSAVGLDCQMWEHSAAVAAAQFINDAYQDVVQEHNGRFRAFGWVPLPYVDAAITEAARCLDELGFAGIAMSCGYQDRPLDDPEFEPFWEEMNRRRAVMYVHPVGAHSCGHFGMSQYGLHTAFGSQVQLPVAATRLVFSGITQRYPDVSFIFAVCGGVLPYLLPRMERNLRRGLEDTALAAVGGGFFAWVKKLPLDASDPTAEFRRFHYDTSVQDVPLGLLAAKQAFGADRLVLGSDEIFASLVEAVETIEQSQYLTADEKAAILDHNAQALLQLTPR